MAGAVTAVYIQAHLFGWWWQFVQQRAAQRRTRVYHYYPALLLPPLLLIVGVCHSLLPPAPAPAPPPAPLSSDSRYICLLFSRSLPSPFYRPTLLNTRILRMPRPSQPDSQQPTSARSRAAAVPPTPAVSPASTLIYPLSILTCAPQHTCVTCEEWSCSIDGTSVSFEVLRIVQPPASCRYIPPPSCALQSHSRALAPAVESTSSSSPVTLASSTTMRPLPPLAAHVCGHAPPQCAHKLTRCTHAPLAAATQ